MGRYVTSSQDEFLETNCLQYGNETVNEVSSRFTNRCLYTTPGTYTFTVPAGVCCMTAVVVGPGTQPGCIALECYVSFPNNYGLCLFQSRVVCRMDTASEAQGCRRLRSTWNRTCLADAGTVWPITMCTMITWCRNLNHHSSCAYQCLDPNVPALGKNAILFKCTLPTINCVASFSCEPTVRTCVCKYSHYCSFYNAWYMPNSAGGGYAEKAFATLPGCQYSICVGQYSANAANIGFSCLNGANASICATQLKLCSSTVPCCWVTEYCLNPAVCAGWPTGYAICEGNNCATRNWSNNILDLSFACVVCSTCCFVRCTALTNSVPDSVRNRVMFPYCFVAGTGYGGDINRTGGYTLCNVCIRQNVANCGIDACYSCAPIGNAQIENTLRIMNGGPCHALLRTCFGCYNNIGYTQVGNWLGRLDAGVQKAALCFRCYTEPGFDTNATDVECYNRCLCGIGCCYATEAGPCGMCTCHSVSMFTCTCFKFATHHIIVAPCIQEAMCNYITYIECPSQPWDTGSFAHICDCCASNTNLYCWYGAYADRAGASKFTCGNLECFKENMQSWTQVGQSAERVAECCTQGLPSFGLEIDQRFSMCSISGGVCNCCTGCPVTYSRPVAMPCDVTNFCAYKFGGSSAGNYYANGISSLSETSGRGCTYQIMKCPMVSNNCTLQNMYSAINCVDMTFVPANDNCGPARRMSFSSCVCDINRGQGSIVQSNAWLGGNWRKNFTENYQNTVNCTNCFIINIGGTSYSLPCALCSMSKKFGCDYYSCYCTTCSGCLCNTFGQSCSFDARFNENCMFLNCTCMPPALTFDGLYMGGNQQFLGERDYGDYYSIGWPIAGHCTNVTAEAHLSCHECHWCGFTICKTQTCNDGCVAFSAVTLPCLGSGVRQITACCEGAAPFGQPAGGNTCHFCIICNATPTACRFCCCQFTSGLCSRYFSCFFPAGHVLGGIGMYSCTCFCIQCNNSGGCVGGYNLGCCCNINRLCTCTNGPAGGGACNIGPHFNLVKSVIPFANYVHKWAPCCLNWNRFNATCIGCSNNPLLTMHSIFCTPAEVCCDCASGCWTLAPNTGFFSVCSTCTANTPGQTCAAITFTHSHNLCNSFGDSLLHSIGLPINADLTWDKFFRWHIAQCRECCYAGAIANTADPIVVPIHCTYVGHCKWNYSMYHGYYLHDYKVGFGRSYWMSCYGACHIALNTLQEKICIGMAMNCTAIDCATQAQGGAGTATPGSWNETISFSNVICTGGGCVRCFVPCCKIPYGHCDSTGTPTAANYKICFSACMPGWGLTPGTVQIDVCDRACCGGGATFNYCFHHVPCKELVGYSGGACGSSIIGGIGYAADDQAMLSGLQITCGGFNYSTCTVMCPILSPSIYGPASSACSSCRVRQMAFCALYNTHCGSCDICPTFCTTPESVHCSAPHLISAFLIIGSPCDFRCSYARACRDIYCAFNTISSLPFYCAKVIPSFACCCTVSFVVEGSGGGSISSCARNLPLTGSICCWPSSLLDVSRMEINLPRGGLGNEHDDVSFFNSARNPSLMNRKDPSKFVGDSNTGCSWFDVRQILGSGAKGTACSTHFGCLSVTCAGPGGGGANGTNFANNNLMGTGGIFGGGAGCCGSGGIGAGSGLCGTPGTGMVVVYWN